MHLYPLIFATLAYAAFGERIHALGQREANVYTENDQKTTSKTTVIKTIVVYPTGKSSFGSDEKYFPTPTRQVSHSKYAAQSMRQKQQSNQYLNNHSDKSAEYEDQKQSQQSEQYTAQRQPQYSNVHAIASQNIKHAKQPLDSYKSERDHSKEVYQGVKNGTHGQRPYSASTGGKKPCSAGHETRLPKHHGSGKPTLSYNQHYSYASGSSTQQPPLETGLKSAQYTPVPQSLATYPQPQRASYVQGIATGVTANNPQSTTLLQDGNYHIRPQDKGRCAGASGLPLPANLHTLSATSSSIASRV